MPCHREHLPIRRGVFPYNCASGSVNLVYGIGLCCDHPAAALHVNLVGLDGGGVSTQCRPRRDRSAKDHQRGTSRQEAQLNGIRCRGGRGPVSEFHRIYPWQVRLGLHLQGLLGIAGDQDRVLLSGLLFYEFGLICAHRISTQGSPCRPLLRLLDLHPLTAVVVCVKECMPLPTRLSRALPKARCSTSMRSSTSARSAWPCSAHRP